jgi:hypothetical protein
MCGSLDCNDNDATVNPVASEFCDGKDNDCNGLIDDPSRIVTSKNSFSFNGVAGVPTLATEVLTITNPPCGPSAWSASDDASWLMLSRTSGVSHDGTILGIDTTGLAPGSYSATITIGVTGANPAGSTTAAVTLVIAADTSAPTGSIKINNGAASTATPTVTLNLLANDGNGSGVTSMRFMHAGLTSAWEPYQTAKDWTLTGGAGSKIVRVQFRDKAGNVSDANTVTTGAQFYSASIILVTSPPTGTILINNGAATTTTPAVTLNLTATDFAGAAVASMRFMHAGLTTAWEPYQTAKDWTLAGSAGAKTVRVQFKDKDGKISDADPALTGAQFYADSITYKPTPP